MLQSKENQPPNQPTNQEKPFQQSEKKAFKHKTLCYQNDRSCGPYFLSNETHSQPLQEMYNLQIKMHSPLWFP